MISSVGVGVTSAGGTGTLYIDKTDDNYGIGENLTFFSTAEDNIAIGENALNSTTGAAVKNIGIGTDTLTALTTADENIAIGYSALEGHLSGSRNIAIGSDAMDGTGAGGSTGASSTDNVALGSYALGGAWTDAQSDHNVAIGTSAMGGLLANVDGSVAIGSSALAALTSGIDNIAIGYMAMDSLTTGEKNIAIGRNAIGNASNAGVDYNIAIGMGAGGSFGDNAVANTVLIGYDAGASINDATASETTAIGRSALTALTTGAGNVAIGYQAGFALTSGNSNTILGYQALDAVNTAAQNTAIGKAAMGSSPIDEAITGCVAIGYHAFLGSGDTADATNYTTAIGHSALAALTTGAGNVAIGYQAGFELTIGDRNTMLGYGAMDDSLAGLQNDDNVFIGFNAGGGTWLNNACSSNVGIGSYCMDDVMDGAVDNTAVGYASLGNIETGGSNVAIGYSSLATSVDVDKTVCIGSAACGTGILTSAADGTVAIGYSALAALTTGDGNVALGYQALAAHTTGARNIAIGHGAMDDTDGQFTDATCNYNFSAVQAPTVTHDVNPKIVAGLAVSGSLIPAGATIDSITSPTEFELSASTDAGSEVTDGTLTFTGLNVAASIDNIFIGYNAGGGVWAETSAASDSNYNVGIGNYVMDAAMDGAVLNTAVGHLALSALTTGDGNSCVGKDAGLLIAGGVKNACVGYEAGKSITSGGWNTCIGYGSNAAATANNQIAIGNGAVSSGANVGIWGNASISQSDITVDWNVTSDRRIKKDIVDSDIGLSFINALKPRKFRRKHPSEWDVEILEKRYKEGGSQYDDEADKVIKDEFDDEKVWNGLIAQELKESMDELDVEFSGWNESPNSKQGIQYSTLVIPLIKAVQELSAEVERLKNK